MPSFHPETISSWDEFVRFIGDKANGWVFRGQREDWSLRTSLERALLEWAIPLDKAPSIEEQMLRDFTRQYSGQDANRVVSDTLYALALMQHHGAPTRLLDFTYSPFVAAKFAVETATKAPVIWCVKTSWCYGAVQSVVGDTALRLRDTDSTRNDSSFRPMYGFGCARKTFVYSENPLYLNARLTLQRGLFLCPGDIALPFEQNLMALPGFDLSANIVKISLRMSQSATYDFAAMLRMMNLDSAALFPGLDGFARALGERLFHHLPMAERRTGSLDHVPPT